MLSLDCGLWLYVTGHTQVKGFFYAMACRFRFSIVKRIIAFFVLLVFCTSVIFISFNRPKEVNAEPITGAVVITGAILAFLAACGVEITSSNMDTTTLQECVEEMTSDYTYDNKTGATAWYADAGTVANVLSGGNAGDKTVIIGSAFSQWLSGLPSHLEQKYGLNTSTSTAIQSSYGFTDVNSGAFYPILPYTSIDLPLSVSDVYPSLIEAEAGNSFYCDLGNNSGFGISISSISGGRIYFVLNNNGLIETSSSAYQAGMKTWILSNGRIYPFRNVGNWHGGTIIGNISGLLSSATSISVEGSLTDGYQDLQDAMDEALGRIETNVDGVIGINVGAMEGTITEEDVWERILADTLDNTFTGELTGDYTDEDEAEEELKQEAMPSVSEMTGNIVVIDGLEDFFPFCIPFDLYEIISLLNVSPVAPKFEWTMNFAGIFDDYDIEIDLSDWETVAQVFRVMVVIGFAVFLIIKTRDLIRG